MTAMSLSSSKSCGEEKESSIIKQTTTWEDDDDIAAAAAARMKERGHTGSPRDVASAAMVVVVAPPIQKAASSQRQVQQQQQQQNVMTSVMKNEGKMVQQQPPRIRNRILPGSMWCQKNAAVNAAPLEPDEPPPAIQATVSLRLAGPSQSGKTSLCQSWVHRLLPLLEPGNRGGSHGEILRHHCYEKVVSYRADMAVRVRLWDETPNPLKNAAIRDNAADSSVTATTPVVTVPHFGGGPTVVDRTLLCIPMPPITDDVNDNNDSSYSDFAKQVRHWKAMIDNNNNNDSHVPASVSSLGIILLVTQADRRPQLQHQLLTDLCDELKIAAWYSVTSSYPVIAAGSNDDDSSIDACFQSIVERILAEKKFTPVKSRRRRRRGKRERDATAAPETITDAPKDDEDDDDDPVVVVPESSSSSPCRRSSRKRSAETVAPSGDGEANATTVAIFKRTKPTPVVVPTTVTPNDRRSLL